MAPLRHAILGVGGVGGLIGACLARSGESVRWWSGRNPSRNILNNFNSKARLEISACRLRAPPRCLPADVLWIAVKATQLEAALAAFTKPESVRAIVPLLNGIDHLALLRARYGAERVIAATIAVETERVAPGHIVHRTPFARLNVSSAGRSLLGAVVR